MDKISTAGSPRTSGRFYLEGWVQKNPFSGGRKGCFFLINNQIGMNEPGGGNPFFFKAISVTTSKAVSIVR